MNYTNPRKKQSKALLENGNALNNLKHHIEALASYKQAAALNPLLVDAWFNSGVTLVWLKRYVEALTNYDRALALNPDYVEAWNNRGTTLNTLKRYDEALASYESALKLKPDYMESWLNRGVTLHALGRHDEAIASYGKALKLNPNCAEAWYNCGTIFFDLKRYDDSLESIERALTIKPDYAEAWNNRGTTLNSLKRYGDSLASIEKALTLKPDYVEAWNNRGASLHEQKRYDEALASFEQGLKLIPNYIECLFNYGATLYDLKRYDEADACIERILALNTNQIEANYNKSLKLLRRERFKEGWELYHWRWKVKTFDSTHIQTNIPPWSENMEIKRLLVWSEQGLGDEIFYTSIVANYMSPEIKITLATEKRLHPLFTRSLPDIELLESKALKSFIDNNKFDAQISICDLGRILSIDKEKIQLKAKSYLKPNLKLQEEYDHFFSDLKPSVICGLSWRSKNEILGNDKSLSLLKLAPLFNLKNIKFVNLQYGDVSEEVQEVEAVLGTKIYINPNLDPTNDIDGLVAQIDMCDIIVTTSNVTSHLAGAIGKKGIILLPFSRGKIWYWHEGEGPSLWYPSLQLISQNKIDDWSECVDGATRWVKENM
jgi:tetratricopeptide (TPR) repeat protein